MNGFPPLIALLEFSSLMFGRAWSEVRHCCSLIIAVVMAMY